MMFHFINVYKTWCRVILVGEVGGFMIGWPIGLALGGGETNCTMACIRAGLLVALITIIHSINKKVKKAVDTNNG